MIKDFTKFLWVSALALIIAAFFVTNIPLKPEMSPISGLIIILLALPSFIAVYFWLGGRRTAILLIILGLYALILETLAIITSFPYSAFIYTDLIGYKLFGYTPYTVPFAYLPLFLGCFYLSTKINSRKLIIMIITAILVLLVDLVLDPAALALKFWTYESSGIFYGVPLMNFTGWLLTGFIAAFLTIIILQEKINDPPPPALAASLFLIITFWGSVCFYLGLLIPGLLAIILLSIIIWETKGSMGRLPKQGTRIIK